MPTPIGFMPTPIPPRYTSNREVTMFQAAQRQPMAYAMDEDGEGECNLTPKPTKQMLRQEKDIQPLTSPMHSAFTTSFESQTTWPTHSASVINISPRSRGRAQSSFDSAIHSSQAHTPARDNARSTFFGSTGRRSIVQFISSPLSQTSSRRKTMYSTPTKSILEHLRAASTPLGLPSKYSPPIPRGAFLPEIPDPVALSLGDFRCGGCGTWIFVKHKLSHYTTCFVARREMQRRMTSDMPTLKRCVEDRTPLAPMDDESTLKLRLARSKSCPMSMIDQPLPAPHSTGGRGASPVDSLASTQFDESAIPATSMDFSFDTPQAARERNSDGRKVDNSSCISQRTRSHSKVLQWTQMAPSRLSNPLPASTPTLLPEFERLPNPGLSTHVPPIQPHNVGDPLSPWLETTNIIEQAIPFPSFTPGSSVTRNPVRTNRRRDNSFIQTLDNASHYFEIFEDTSSLSEFDSDEEGSSEQFSSSEVVSSSPIYEQAGQFEAAGHVEQAEFAPPQPEQQSLDASDLAPVSEAEPYLPRARRQRRSSMRAPRTGNSPTPGSRQHFPPLTPIIPTLNSLPNTIQEPLITTLPNPITPPNPHNRAPGEHAGDTWTTLHGHPVYEDASGRVWSEEGHLLAVMVVGGGGNMDIAAEIEMEDAEMMLDNGGGEEYFMGEIGDAGDENVLSVAERRRFGGMAGAWMN